MCGKMLNYLLNYCIILIICCANKQNLFHDTIALQKRSILTKLIHPLINMFNYNLGIIFLKNFLLLQIKKEAVKLIYKNVFID
jgi:hypothetical protein